MGLGQSTFDMVRASVVLANRHTISLSSKVDVCLCASSCPCVLALFCVGIAMFWHSRVLACICVGVLVQWHPDHLLQSWHLRLEQQERNRVRMKNVSERERRENHRHARDNVDRRNVSVNTEVPLFSLEVERRRARRGRIVGDSSTKARVT